MPKFKVRVVAYETIKSEGFVEVEAPSLDEAKFRVDEMIEMCEVDTDENWVVFGSDTEYQQID